MYVCTDPRNSLLELRDFGDFGIYFGIFGSFCECGDLYWEFGDLFVNLEIFLRFLDLFGNIFL